MPDVPLAANGRIRLRKTLLWGIKIIVLPFRFAWLLVVRARLRRAAGRDESC